jgi:hypothetical protein
MKRPHVLATYEVSSDEKALLQEMLGDEAAPEFLEDLPSAQRRSAWQAASVLLAGNFPREIPALEYPDLQQVQLIQFLSAGADHMPSAHLPPHILFASSFGQSAATSAHSEGREAESRLPVVRLAGVHGGVNDPSDRAEVPVFPFLPSFEPRTEHP